MRKYIDILIFTSCLKNVREYSLVQKKKKRFKDLYNWTDFPLTAQTTG